MVTRSTRAVVALALVLVVGLAAGCGDDADTAGEGSGDRDGRTLFLEGTSPSCGTCHTLSAAGTTSQVGPNLDELVAPDWFIAQTVREGFGIMPSFEGQLSDAEIDTLAAYVEAGSSR